MADPPLRGAGRRARARPARSQGLIHLSIGRRGRRGGACAGSCATAMPCTGAPRARTRDRQGRAARSPAGRAARPRRRASVAASAARCTSSMPSTGSWARPASSAATSRSRSAARSRRAGAATAPVAVVFFGDGAVQGGIFNESVNLATLWELPLMLVCENNGFAEFTPRSAHTNVERVSDVVAPYGVERDDRGRRRRRRRSGTRSAASSLRPAPGHGPFLLECLTHRLRGHYEGDPGALPRGAGGRGVAGEGSDRPADPRARRGWSTRSTREAEASRARSSERSRFARESAFPPVELIEQLVYADA